MPAQPSATEQGSSGPGAPDGVHRWTARPGRRLGLTARRRPIPLDEHDALASTDPEALCRVLEGSDRFHRDTGLGGILHYGKVSFREKTPTDSLHIIIDGNRISAHVDDISPLRVAEDGTARYSLSTVVAHNLSGALADLLRVLGGRHGEQRCNMACEVVWVDDGDAVVEKTGGC